MNARLEHSITLHNGSLFRHTSLMDAMKYAGLVLTRATEKSVGLTDRLTILLVPFGTLLAWLLKTPKIGEVGSTMAISIAIMVVAAAAARLVTAPFLIWRDDQTKIDTLTDALNAPSRASRIAAREYAIELRKRLSDKLSEIVAISGLIPIMARASAELNEASFGAPTELIRKYFAGVLDVQALIASLSYDTKLRVACTLLVEETGKCLKATTSEKDFKAAMARVAAMKKAVFELLHQQSAGEAADLLLLLQVQNVAEYGPSHDKPFDLDADVPTDPVDKLDWLRAAMRDPKVGPALQAAMKEHDR